jgi:O-antigen/teichoic acid export membrane protein
MMLRNSTFNVLGMALIVPLNFVALFTLARRLGKESLGIFFTLFAISAVIYLLASSGATMVLTRRIAQSRQDLRRIVGEAAGVLVVVCAVSIVALLLVCGVWSTFLGEALGWPLVATAAVALAARHTLEFAAAAVRGVERFEFENMARVVQTGLFCLLVLLFVSPEQDGTLVAFVTFALSNVVAAVFLAALLITKWDCRSFRINRRLLRGWFLESWPLGAGDIIRQAGWQLETLMLAALKAPAAVGLYSVAYRPLQPLQILPRSLVSVTYPMMSRAAVTDRSAVRTTVAESTALLWMLSLPVAISVTVCARPLIHATAGQAYDAATLPLQLLIWLTGFTFVNTQIRFTFSAVGWERLFCFVTMGVLVAKLVAAAICIPLWGIYGACLGNLLGEVLLSVSGLSLLRGAGMTSIPWGRLAASSAAGAIMAGSLAPLTNSGASLAVLLLACAGSTLLFLVLCLAFRAIRWQQVHNLIHVLGVMCSQVVTRRVASQPQEGSEATTCSVG